jgi:hypothetical protein
MNTQDTSALSYQRSMPVRFLMQVLWPAFVASIVTTGLVFSAIDPERIAVFGQEHGHRREALYTVGFLVIWAQYVFACALTWWITAGDAQRVARRTHSASSDAKRQELA